eukprot:2905627-Amphidinium_carterae.1
MEEHFFAAFASPRRKTSLGQWLVLVRELLGFANSVSKRSLKHLHILARNSGLLQRTSLHVAT